MGLNKKQKKQLEVGKKKLSHLRQQLAGAKQQLDDPSEVGRLEQEIVMIEAQLQKIRSSDA